MTANGPDAGATISVMLIVPDADAAIAWYKDAPGATPGSAVVDHEVPWGTHRQGGFHDPFGHNWSVGDRSPLQSG